VFIPLTVGGGVRSVADVDLLLRAGADKVGVNTAAVARPELSKRLPNGSAVRSSCCPSMLAVLTGPRRIRGHDARRRRGTGSMPSSGRHAGKRARCRRDPAQLDGRGWHRARLRPRDDPRVRAAVSLPVIASGGAGTVEHFAPAVDAGADAVLAASVFHFGTCGSLTSRPRCVVPIFRCGDCASAPPLRFGRLA